MQAEATEKFNKVTQAQEDMMRIIKKLEKVMVIVHLPAKGNPAFFQKI